MLKGLRKEKLLILAQELYDPAYFSQCFMVLVELLQLRVAEWLVQVSALHGQQVDPLKEDLHEAALEGAPWQFEADQVALSAHFLVPDDDTQTTAVTLEKTIAEAVREQVTDRQHMHAELPLWCRYTAGCTRNCRITVNSEYAPLHHHHQLSCWLLGAKSPDDEKRQKARCEPITARS